MEAFIVLGLRYGSVLQKHIQRFLLAKIQKPVLFSVIQMRPVDILYICVHEFSP